MILFDEAFRNALNVVAYRVFSFLFSLSGRLLLVCRCADVRADRSIQHSRDMEVFGVAKCRLLHFIDRVPHP